MTQDKEHKYLGITINYSIEGKFMIRMDDYVENLLSKAREDMGGVT